MRGQCAHVADTDSILPSCPIRILAPGEIATYDATHPTSIERRVAAETTSGRATTIPGRARRNLERSHRENTSLSPAFGGNSPAQNRGGLFWDGCTGNTAGAGPSCRAGQHDVGGPLRIKHADLPINRKGLRRGCEKNRDWPPDAVYTASRSLHDVGRLPPFPNRPFPSRPWNKQLCDASCYWLWDWA
jgi:hypothetical protein